jgi:two-component system, OmpR family, response regulator MprA
MHWKVALVEGDHRLARAVAAGLREGGYRVRSVASAAEGLELAQEWNPDLILLDPVLPDSDGPDLFGRFREVTDAALVGISAKSAVSDVVAALRAGADDYVVKPFAMEELAARLHAVLRRSRGTGGERMQVADLRIDVAAGTAHRGQRRAALTAIEFRLLCALGRQAGKLLNQGQLLDIVWPVGQGPDSNSIEVHIARLRRKLEAGGEGRILHTVRGMGYVLKPDA